VSAPGPLPAVVEAPAKLTLSLRVTGVRGDGYHELDAEMVSLDLADVIELDAGSGLTIVDETPGGLGLGDLGADDDNLVARAARALGLGFAARLRKRIPAGAGLGGGSSDAAAVLRWAGCRDLTLAARLGADVPFCVAGGRARVRGIGEQVTPLPVEDRRFALLLAPFGVDTASVYRAWDDGHRTVDAASVNDLEGAALAVEPRLGRWRAALARMTGRPAMLAGSGATWFVELSPDDPPVATTPVEVDGQYGVLIEARTRPAEAED